ncbi:hypothetical protein [Acidiphilium sp.]|uniref:hypothetical protein n=1 Tax=Acidiphilium sp. TaxID=527 RepID=UPI002CE64207|nr:hypothetical protein [Acidiphilium sp.]HQT62766.1 hypothetical protein [Acidiphilium sp.]
MSETTTPAPVVPTAPVAPSAPESLLGRLKAEIEKIAHEIGVEEQHLVDLVKAHL